MKEKDPKYKSKEKYKQNLIGKQKFKLKISPKTRKPILHKNRNTGGTALAPKNKKMVTLKDLKGLKQEHLNLSESVARHLEGHYKETLSNLARGLKVDQYDVDRARKSLHRARRIVIKQMMAYSYSDTEICLELDVNAAQLMLYKRKLLAQEIETLKNTTAEEQFVMFRSSQLEVIKDCDVIINKFRDEPAYKATVAGMLKLKSEAISRINDKMEKMGFMKVVKDIDNPFDNLNLESFTQEEIIAHNKVVMDMMDDINSGKKFLNKDKISNVININKYTKKLRRVNSID